MVPLLWRHNFLENLVMYTQAAPGLVASQTLAHLRLCIINLLQALNLLVFCDLLQIAWSSIKKCNNDVYLPRHSNIVCIVTGHKRDVPQ